ncbi:hypothetical protein F5144DRAFT_503455 [Chaetomium tenue]|uniref:Uncharacterized protein n=1 Tax=Chaetomium tenue TaxID=1854479 RepID=A0ACB7PTR1_9PEZI|nr:hypothetical protein F5144DRAFT_503455 [Chaetomium globosum]
MAKSKSGLSVSSKAIDPTLDALFSHSAGAVKTPPKSRYVDLLPQRPRAIPENEGDEEDEDASESEEVEGSEEESGDEGGAELGAEDSDDDEDMLSSEDDSGDDEADAASSADDETAAAEVLERAATRGPSQDEARKRKRKQRDDDENLEANYFERLANEDEPSGKRHKADSTEKDVVPTASKVEKEDDDESGDDVPVHESVAARPAVSELEKANRTVFLSNVAAEAITSRKAKKTLLKHLSSILDKKADPPQKVESIRFRSTAFESAGIPKRAAFIKKEVLEATTKSTNAYAVYSTTAAARLAVAQLNGTVVLDRHLRVDSVAHPAAVDHRRCVFVGNLGFVDDESVYNVKVNEEGKEVGERRKRTKTPMDVEEGLWRVFGKEGGKVESVRVVRDAATRVGKGFAYVQFYDGNSVESAILINGKKFPPMLPRELRVTRCKAPHKTARAMEARNQRAPAASDRKGGKFDKRGGKPDTGSNAEGKYVPKPTAESQTLAGRASKLLGRFGAAKLAGKAPGLNSKKRRDRRDRFVNRGGEAAGGETGGIKGPEQFVFEGRRASAKDGKPKDLKFKKGKTKAKPPNKKGKGGKVGKY